MLKEKVFEMDDAMNTRTDGCNEHPMLKLNKRAFTRNRKLGAKRLVIPARSRISCDAIEGR
jgi:hypothetical protein